MQTGRVSDSIGLGQCHHVSPSEWGLHLEREEGREREGEMGERREGREREGERGGGERRREGRRDKRGGGGESESVQGSGDSVYCRHNTIQVY